jgi:hypothetical protein
VLGTWVKVTSMARYGSEVVVEGYFGVGKSCSPISAGRSVGELGRSVGGSIVISVGERTSCARGPILVRIWYRVSRK